MTHLTILYGLLLLVGLGALSWLIWQKHHR
jgi:hypothetical protein